MTSDRDWLVLSWSGTGQLAGAVAALPGTTCVFATNNNQSIVLILITKKQRTKQDEPGARPTPERWVELTKLCVNLEPQKIQYLNIHQVHVKPKIHKCKV